MRNLSLVSFVLGVALIPAALATAQTCYQRPFSRVGDPWGCTAACGRSSPHRGVDFPAPEGTPIPAIADGIVHRPPWSSCIGNVVVIEHPDGMFSGYAHMSEIDVTSGQHVSKGQVIGLVGHTGSCQTGPHLHLTMGTTYESYASGTTIDPLSYIDAHTTCRPDHDHDGSLEGDDCDDHDPNNRPGGREGCDGRDNDCDTRVDEDVTRICGSDVGSCRTGVQTCTAASWGDCVGEVPAAAEICNALDDDCDGEADESRTCEHQSARDARFEAPPAQLSSNFDGDLDFDACMRTPAGMECAETDLAGFRHLVRGPALADEDGWDDVESYATLRMGDVDGDGASELCARRGDEWACDPIGHAEPHVRVSIPLGLRSPGSPTAEVWLVDLDGDGVADPCVRDVDGLRCRASRVGEVALAALSDDAGLEDVARHGTIRFGDVSGDGRDDVCVRLASGMTCWLFGEHGFVRRVEGPRWTDADGWTDVARWSTIRLADVDGDGRDDLCARGPDGFRCATSRDRSFDSVLVGPALSDAEGWSERSGYATLRMGDIDGDGAADLCGRAHDGIHCWLAGARGFDREVRGPALSDEAGWSENARFETLRLGDVDGDGRADLCARDAGGLRCWTSARTPFDRERVLPAWSDLAGLGDESYGSTLVIAGIGSPRSTTQLTGTWACSASASRGGGTVGAWALLATSLLLARRRRSARG